MEGISSVPPPPHTMLEGLSSLLKSSRIFLMYPGWTYSKDNPLYIEDAWTKKPNH